MNKKSIAIIMRTKNSDWILSQTLKALFSQNRQDFRLYIVDSGSTDSTLEIARQYPCEIRTIPPSHYYPGKVLNEEIEKTNEEVIIFLNSDSVLTDPDAIEKIVNELEDESIAGAFGRQLPRCDADVWVKRDYEIAYPSSQPNPDWLPFSLAFAAIKKTAWELHPFYTQAWGSEDIEWAVWMKKNGFKIHYVPEAAAIHSHNYTFRQLYGRRFIEGEADAFIYQRPHSLWNTANKIIRSTANDALYYIKSNHWRGLPLIPIRRSVEHISYYLGHRHGVKRIQENDTDASTGQQIVFSSESNHHQ